MTITKKITPEQAYNLMIVLITVHICSFYEQLSEEKHTTIQKLGVSKVFN